MVLRAAGVVASLCLGLTLGCAGSTVGGEDGGDDDAPATGGQKATPPAGDPRKQCETYAATWCEKSFGCFVKQGQLDQGALKYNVDQCKKLIIEKLPCSAVTSVVHNSRFMPYFIGAVLDDSNRDPRGAGRRPAPRR